MSHYVIMSAHPRASNERRFVPHAAPETSGPIAACRTTDKWRFCHTTGKRVYLLFSLPHCKQVGLTQHTANQTENTGGDSQCGSDRYARPKAF